MNVSRSLHHDKVDMEAFMARMVQCDPPTLGMVSQESIQNVVKESCIEINRIAKECKKMNVARERSGDQRWKRLMEENDSGKIWKAVNWKGEINPNQGIAQFTDSDFKTHFEELLNPGTNDEGEIVFEEAPYIPILDDPFTSREM
ncbi:hypothetical protein E2C01_069507 [Portunus trituberculatus]|uniref:Uncharacterized protein n=1 Tax=Portunus trituberculatus TaxID=210409 RepID=A0A5B7HUQ4_PORTR|nr:hypothetical protein [Portunus trituberculatus]